MDLRIRRVVAVPMHMLRPALGAHAEGRMQLTGIILLSLGRHVPGFLLACGYAMAARGLRVSAGFRLAA